MNFTTSPQSLPRSPVTFAWVSIAFTLCVWIWIFIQPESAFHDQGGLTITLVYFPATLAAWLLCAIISIVLALRRTDGGRLATFGLVALGLLLSIGTLFTA